ncbi:MAG: hypothetical protein EXR46_04475 [Dehalococcoidia bacterium]|nr:hypothetical protein [Dehalococcoidia bacterium]
MTVGHGLLAALLLLLTACATAPAATPFPFPIQVAPPEPTLDLSNCSTRIYCGDCPAIPVRRVIDGDTFDSGNGRIRLYGVDTPERGERCLTEATQRFAELAENSVRVQFGPRQGDAYGRILYYVYTARGESIDELLIREGLALAWTRDGQHRDTLVAAEAQASMHRTGFLWAGG